MIPFCAKQSNPILLKTQCLATTTDDQDVLIFIADGEVMEEASMAVGITATLTCRLTLLVAAQLKVIVENALT